MTRLPRPARAAVVLTSLLALTATVAATGTADAATWSRPDPRGDGSGSTYSADPPPCGSVETTPGVDPTIDVTRLRVQHRRQVVRVRVSFADLRRDPEQSGTLHLRTPDGDVDVELFTAGGRLRAWWFPVPTSQEDPDPDGTGGTGSTDGTGGCGTTATVSEGGYCNGLGADLAPGRDRITVAVPRSCLDRPRWVHAGFTASLDVDGRSEVDRWAPAGDAGTGRAVHGAKVRAPARTSG